ncbi:tubulin polyglutamylase ttll6-like isoform X2 [Frankliniella occidentalis]|uniref:Tubulin polyglutamylase ttll6-like isoform X2 n=1 Tax=Frankliniella occidentalis TaxID=133901 RepID=A0A9C6TWS9_FRAOC|nr:tubulin polyglutamylase ttll6-like isoform X2 [Frankliniella occidentalis]
MRDPAAPTPPARRAGHVFVFVVMVLTTGLLEAPRPSALVGAMPVQPATVLVPAPAPAPAAPPGAAPPATDARDCGSSSSSSCGSYSDHEDNEDEPPARLTLQDDAVPATDASASEWEASGEEGEAGEDSCDGEGEDRDDGGGVHSVEDLAGPPRGTTTGPVTASKTASSLHLQGRPGEQLGPRRASLCALPKVPPAASPAQHAQHAPPDRRIPLKKREQNVPLASRRKRRRRRRPLSLCTANCRYDVVRRVSKRFGMKDVSEDEPWNLYWTDLSISLERCKDMKRFQKINHFPGMAEICRKDLLARNLNRMLRLFPKDYNFFPKTWCLPADLGDLNTYARTRRNRTYILKPDTGCQGKGIYLTRSVRDLKPHTRMICQVYIARPFLVDGFKFDMRVYTLVTSCDPLRVFVYNDGLVRFATSAYHEPNGHNTANVFMHLTNYAVNKHSRTFIVDEEAGSKRKISTLNKWLESKNYDVVDIWARIDELIVKTLIAALPVIRHNYHACFPAHDFTYACFELLGFDVLLDHKLKPYVLEVNHSPSFHTDAQIDREVKETLLMDTFGILNLGQYDKRKVMEEDRRRVRDRLLQSIAHRDTGSDSNVLTADSNPWKAQFDWEDSNMGNFRRVYPVPDGQPDKYEAFFHQNQSSLFQETAASRAREEASRQQRDLHEVKQKEEEARRSMTLARRREYERLRPESPGVGAAPGTLLRRSRNSRGKRGAAQPPAAGKKLHAKCVLNSFLPEAIVEAEESVRAAALQERGQLVQSKGIVQLIYQMMKENKSLCAEDLRKYAALNAEPHSGHSQGPAGAPGTNGGPRREDDAHRLPSLLTLIQKTTGQGHADINRGKGVVDPYEALVTGLPGPCPIPPGAGPTGPGPAGESAPLVAAAVPAVSLPLRPALCSRTPGFGMTCAEAPFWVRPGLRSSDLWSSNYMLLSSQAAQAAHQLYTQSQGQAVPRNTRSTLGRLVSTSFKLHNLEKRHPKPQVQQL